MIEPADLHDLFKMTPLSLAPKPHPPPSSKPIHGANQFNLNKQEILALHENV